MNVDNLTLGEIKKLQSLFGSNSSCSENTLPDMIGKKCIVRTYSAGCWFGIVDKKVKNEIILKDARRLYLWNAKKSISLSAVALYGLCEKRESKICAKLSAVWLEAVELIIVTPEAIKSIEEYPEAEQTR